MIKCRKCKFCSPSIVGSLFLENFDECSNPNRIYNYCVNERKNGICDDQAKNFEYRNPFIVIINKETISIIIFIVLIVLFLYLIF